ncbi:eukaryotic translation initiation factor 4 gamma 1-like isoform X2 [Pleurodeles waltl]
MNTNPDCTLSFADLSLKPESDHDLLCRMDNILSRLTPRTFRQLIKEVNCLPIKSEAQLNGVVDLIIEKVVAEPNSSDVYAKLCRSMMGLKVPSAKNRAQTLNFRKVLLNRCQAEFVKDDREMFRKKAVEMDAAGTPEEKIRLNEELELARDQSRRRHLGNIMFTGELFKLGMLTEGIMHDCVVKLFKKKDEESLERLCWLLSTIGKDLDSCKDKPRMDQYFNQIEKIIKERKISSQTHVLLQDLIELRMRNWVPLSEEVPKTADQIHKLAQVEEQSEDLEKHNLTPMKHDDWKHPSGHQGSAAGACWREDGQEINDVKKAVLDEKDSQPIGDKSMV